MYYTLYAFLTITITIIIIIIIIVFQLKQSAIIKRALIGLVCVAWARNCLITSRARETREGGRRPPPPFSPPPPPRPPKRKKTGDRLWLALIWNVYARVKARKESGEEGPGAREKKVRLCCWFFYNKFGEEQEQAPTQVPNHNKFFDAQVHYGPLWHWG